MPALPVALERLTDTLLPLDTPVAGLARGLRPAAVMVMLFPDGGVRFVLTERPMDLNRHPGQISLPGGAAEPGDVTLWDTAARETWEELGIDADTLEAIGVLPPVEVQASNYLIHPFVAWTAERPSIVPDRREVRRAIEVPLDWLLDPGRIKQEIWQLRGRPYAVTFYDLGVVVWGATARVLGELTSRLEPGVVALQQPGAVVPV